MIEETYQNEIYRTIQDLFNLDSKDLLILNFIISSDFPELCMKEFKKIDVLPERTLQRRLNQLVKKGLITRRAISITEFLETCLKHNERTNFNHDTTEHELENARGYIYLYKLTPKEELKKVFTSIIEIWK